MMPHLNVNDLINSLRKKLDILNKQVALLDEIQTRKNKTATQKESAILEQTLNFSSNEEMAIILHNKAKNRQRKQNNIGNQSIYDPFLLTRMEQSNFIRYLAGIDINEAQQIDFIAKLGGWEGISNHCTPVHIDVNSDSKNMFFVDASLDTSNDSIQANITNCLNTSAHMSHIGTQQNNFSCFIFSLQDLNSMSKLTLQELNNSFPQGDTRVNSDSFTSLKEINPRFIKNTQSLALLKTIPENKKNQIVSKNKNIEEYIEDFSITVSIANNTYYPTYKKRNFSILRKTQKYVKEALDTVQDLHNDNKDEEIQQIIQHRMGQKLLNSVYKGLTNEEYDKVKGLYNKKQISLILDHSIPREMLKNHQCFQNNKLTHAVYDYIVAGSSQKEKLKRAQYTQKFRTFEEMEAKLKYKLEIDSYPISCLVQENYDLREEALKRIEQTYQKDPTNVQNFYKSISNIKNKADLILMLDYGIDYEMMDHNKQLSDKILETIKNFTRNLKENGSTYSTEEENDAIRVFYRQISKMTTTQQIDAICNLKLDPEVVRYTCLRTPEASEEAYDYLEKIYYQAQEADKNAAVSEALNNIKNIHSPLCLKLINRYEIDPVSIGESIFLNSSHRDLYKLFGSSSSPCASYIKKWHDTDGKEGANLAFKSLNMILGKDPNFLIDENLFNRLASIKLLDELRDFTAMQHIPKKRTIDAILKLDDTPQKKAQIIANIACRPPKKELSFVENLLSKIKKTDREVLVDKPFIDDVKYKRSEQILSKIGSLNSKRSRWL